ncbi:glycosyltransferase family 2 protein [Roseibium sp.]|uniref:glycosyltransferase family 2 protein n=1 Tax=Roseibium sp. TaxID=1936156 RepID=UPI003B50593A
MSSAPDASNGQIGMSAPSVAVIIPHYNDVARLEKCLDALFSKSGETALSGVDVIVVDNNSPADLDRVKADYPMARFVTEMAKGAAAARNRGVRETSADALFFLDADCIPAADWLNEARRSIQQVDKGVIGGRIDTFDETPPPRSGAEVFETVFAFKQKRYVEEKGFSVTANLLTTRAVFENTGDFMVGVSEDVDWCWRARAKGHKLVYDDKVVVSHPTRQDWPALLKKWRRMVDEGYLLNGNGASARIRWAIRSFAILGSVFVHLPRVLLHKDLRSWEERWLGVATLFRLRFWRSFTMLRQALTPTGGSKSS